MALVALPSPRGSRTVDHEGFIVSQNYGAPEYHWIRIQGVDAATGSTANAVLQAAPSLEALLGGGGGNSGLGAAAAAGALGAVMARLRSAPSLESFMSDLQARPGPGSSRPGVASSTAGAAAAPTSAAASPVVGVGGGCISSTSGRLMGLLLADLDALGWGCLDDLDQDAARLSLLLTDGCGRQHQLRLSLPPDYPASPPAAATDLPAPLAFAWVPPAPAAPGLGSTAYPQQHQQHQRSYGQQGGAGGWGGGFAGGSTSTSCSCSSLVDVYRAFEQAVERFQPLWECLDDLDRQACVLDPPPTVSAGRRHLGPPTRRLALGGAASLQLRLDPGDPRGPPPAAAAAAALAGGGGGGGGVAFLGPPEQVEELRAAFFDHLHLWSRDRSPVENLELVLGRPLPRPAGSSPGAAAGGAGCGGSQQQQVPGGGPHVLEAAAECPICLMHMLPLGGVGGGAAGDAAEELDDVDMEAGGGGGGVSGLVPDVVCPTPACGLAFHTPCLAEWLRSVPDTRVSFNKLFGRCPFCSNPITARA
ncbi:hypothetical protein HYH02_010567 [Chlamydomonas schloesseri]|uniref:RING-type domain-containing protein n=1 Tax=Chlamydomonas schloesseri TaxID=2026947 RepID=A0A835TJN4_9CHLO|nr:hypothetical protein HYH02_010567 [Chlamydomonas schloesseri]|eukprot:KAG2439686.1 hypothetical protein HYH02_010567 [Chlamydomonas schloesseri]